MNEEMMKSLGSFGLSRSVQQKLKKIPGQQLNSMLQQYGAFDLGETENLTAREKLRRRIRQKEQTRFGAKSAKREESKQQQQEPTEAPLTEAEKKKRQKNRMKRLKEKYGQVSDEDYYEALNKTQGVDVGKLSKSERDSIQKYFNLVDLYNYQHREAEVEKEIDLDDF